jgi:hypothetical protein
VLELGAGSDDDLLAQLRDLLPADDRWRHRTGAAGHGRDTWLPALVAPVSLTAAGRGPAASRSEHGSSVAWSTSTSTTPSGSVRLSSCRADR